MREPTEAMVEACYGGDMDWGPDGTGDEPATPKGVWQAMIDAALPAQSMAEIS
jgi:hypothetical protein